MTSDSLKALIQEIDNDVKDVTQTGFEYATTFTVPRKSDDQLTFERDVIKKGKILRSCVLYVDIRNSVELTKKHGPETMGKIYTAFSKAVLKVAKCHFGHIRNIIGDRVMIVFPSHQCFTNSVDCAITINYIAKNVINNRFNNFDFKCGIGIDHGDLRVIKVGLQRRGHEGVENRSLVWVGDPANIASRLTDTANKVISKSVFEITRIKPQLTSPFSSSGFNLSLLVGQPHYYYNPGQYSPYLEEETVELSTEEFADKIVSFKDGTLYMYGGRCVKIKKKKENIVYPEILMTKDVLDGLKIENPARLNVKDMRWTEQQYKIKNVSKKVFGSNLIWKY